MVDQMALLAGSVELSYRNGGSFLISSSRKAENTLHSGSHRPIFQAPSNTSPYPTQLGAKAPDHGLKRRLLHHVYLTPAACLSSLLTHIPTWTFWGPELEPREQPPIFGRQEVPWKGWGIGFCTDLRFAPSFATWANDYKFCSTFHTPGRSLGELHQLSHLLLTRTRDDP